MRRFLELNEETKSAAICDVEEWGYPREVTQAEVDHGIWLRYGLDCIIWFTMHDLGQLGVHICIEPGSRYGRAVTRKLLTGIDVIGELLGAESVCAIPMPGLEEIHSYCKRLGWVLNSTGWYIHRLGDE